MKRKIINIFLTVVLAVSMTGCAPNSDASMDTDGTLHLGDWAITSDQQTNAMYLDAESIKDEGSSHTVKLTCEESAFKDGFSKNNLKVAMFSMSDDYTAALNDAKEQASQIDVTGMTSEEATAAVEKEYEKLLDDINISKYLTYKMIQNVSLTSVSTDSITFSYTGTDGQDDATYLYAVNDAGMDNGNYAFGYDYFESETPEAVMEDTYSIGQINPTIRVRIENTSIAEKLSSADVTLSGVFAQLSVKSAAVKDGVIEIATEGTVQMNGSTAGYIDLDGKATSSGNALTASTSVANNSYMIDPNAYSLNDGNLRIGLFLDQNIDHTKFAGNVTFNDDPVTSVTVDSTGEIYISLPVQAKTIDDAMKEIDGKQIVFSSEVMGDAELTIPLVSAQATLLMNVKSLVKNSDGSYTADAIAAADQNGTIKDGLTADKVTFVGDFYGAEVNTISFDQNQYEIIFTFTPETSGTSFTGGIFLSEGILKNSWGTSSQIPFGEIVCSMDNTSTAANTTDSGSASIAASRYILALAKNIVREETVSNGTNSIKEIFEKIKSMYEGGKTAKLLYDAIMNISSLKDIDGVVKAGKALLTWMEIIKPEEDNTAQKTLQNVKDIAASVKLLDNKISDLQSQVSTSASEIIAGVNKNSILTACGNWNNFKTGSITPLKHTISTLDNNVRAGLVDYVRADHGTELVLYYDENGSLAIPNAKSPKYSIDGTKINADKTVKLTITDATFASSEAVLAGNKFRYSTEFNNALKNDLDAAVKAAGISVTGDALASYIQTQVTLKAMDQNTMNQIQNEYVSLCEAICGDSSGSPLDSYYSIMYSTYNFESEAANSITTMNTYLKSLVIQYGAMAAYASSLNPGYDTDGDPIGKAEYAAMQFLDRNTGLHGDTEDEHYVYVWCYPADGYVTAKALNLELNTDGTNNFVSYCRNNEYNYTKAEVPYTTPVALEHYTSADLQNAKIVSNNVLTAMYARFNNLGMNKTMTFRDYLISEDTFKDKMFVIDGAACYTGISQIRRAYTNYRVNYVLRPYHMDPEGNYAGFARFWDIQDEIITKFNGIREFPLDGSRSMRCVESSGGIGFYGASHMYSDDYPVFRLGNNGTGDPEKFVKHNEVYGTTFNMSNGTANDSAIIVAFAQYVKGIHCSYFRGMNNWNMFLTLVMK